LFLILFCDETRRVEPKKEIVFFAREKKACFFSQTCSLFPGGREEERKEGKVKEVKRETMVSRRRRNGIRVKKGGRVRKRRL